MFPEKVKIPALSLKSLVRISEKCVALDVWKNRWFLCSYKVTHNRVSRPLFENAIQALRKPGICRVTRNDLVPVPIKYCKKTPKKECLINLSVWKGPRRKLQDTVGVRRGDHKRFRIRNGKVYALH